MKCEPALVAALFLLSTPVQAQRRQPLRPTSIPLSARLIEPAPGIDAGLTARAGSLGDRQRFHAYLQFHSGTSRAQRQRVARELDIRLLERISPLSYLASADRRVLDALPREIRWVGAIRPADRRSGDLTRLASTPRSPRRAAAIVRFFSDVDTATQRYVLASRGLTDVTRVPYLNGWSVIGRTDSLVILSNADEVRWISLPPLAPEPDNDGVRGALGVNADAVALGTHYGLSGNGVTVAAWDDVQASDNHAGFAGRITIVGPVALWARYMSHTEAVAANDRYDDGEVVYVDMNDDGCVSVGDHRVSALGAIPAAQLVAAGDPDLTSTCPALQAFWLGDPAGHHAEKYVDLDGNLLWSPSEPVYEDMNDNGVVDLAVDVRRSTAGASSGATLTSFHNRHGHPTQVAGTIMGSGAGSAGGIWRGVAQLAQLRSYATCATIQCIANEWSSSATSYVTSIEGQFIDALAHGASVIVVPWGSLGSHFFQLTSTGEPYGPLADLFDQATSGLTHEGQTSQVGQLAVVASAGNQGRPERHAENVAINGRYDAGEAIYLDFDGDGRRSAPDNHGGGATVPLGTPLIDFLFDEMHSEGTSGARGYYDSGEAIYRDVDRNGSVTTGDLRVHPAGLPVAAGDPDAAAFLRPFKHWGTLRSENAAKNTLQIGNIAFDGPRLHISSSRGPTRDGRIKPDLVAAGFELGGDGQVTTTHTRDRYTTNWGTSLSTGAAAGAVTLLSEALRNACGAPSATPLALRALLIHAAEDVVAADQYAFPGPDFASGFGRVRVKEAVDLAAHHVVGKTAESMPEILVTIGRHTALRVTLTWSDAPHPPGLEPGLHGFLQNDLDLTLIAPDGREHSAWKASALVPHSPATRVIMPPGMSIPEAMRDRANTVEQVVVDDAMPGTWRIRIVAAQLEHEDQPFAVVSEAINPSDGACASASATDLWLRDNGSDDGTEPSAGLLYLSPDIWNRPADDGSSAHANPQAGQVNYLYGTLRNRGAAATATTTVEVWIAQASTGLSWPEDFSLVGRMHAPNMAAGETRVIGPLPWIPPLPAGSSHFCLYIRVLNAQDGLSALEASDVGSNTRANNNIGWRNLQIVNLASERAERFLIRNIDTTSRFMRLEIRTPATFTEAGGYIRIGVPAAIGGALDSTRATGLRPWRVPGVTTSPGARLIHALVTGAGATTDSMPLRPREAHPVVLTFGSSDQRSGSHDIDVIQWVGNRIVGGIRYVVQTGSRPP